MIFMITFKNLFAFFLMAGFQHQIWAFILALFQTAANFWGFCLFRVFLEFVGSIWAINYILFDQAFRILYNMFPKSMFTFPKTSNLPYQATKAHQKNQQPLQNSPVTHNRSSQKSGLANTLKINTAVEPDYRGLKGEPKITKYLTTRNCDQDPDFVSFLNRVHNRASEVNLVHQCSQSEIIENFQVCWSEDPIEHSRHMIQQTHADELFLTCQQGEISQSQDIGINHLKAVNSLSELADFLSKVNPTLSQNLTNLIKQNIKLTEEVNGLRYTQKKRGLKIQLLNNQIDILEKKNQELCKAMACSPHMLTQSRQQQFSVEITKQLISEQPKDQMKSNRSMVAEEEKRREQSTRCVKSSVQLFQTGQSEQSGCTGQTKLCDPWCQGRKVRFNSDDYHNIVKDILRPKQYLP